MKNQYIIDGEICWIKLTQGQWTQIDVADMGLVKDYRWCASKVTDGFYVVTHEIGTHKKLMMHRVILDCPKGMEVDHKRHNTLDNRRCAIKSVTHSENNLNRRSLVGSSSSYVGVTWEPSRKKWKSNLYINGKSSFVGRFDDEITAAIYRAKVFVEYYGPQLNPVQSNYPD